MSLTVVCAWCGRTLGVKPDVSHKKPESERISHGICSECKDHITNEYIALRGETVTGARKELHVVLF